MNVYKRYKFYTVTDPIQRVHPWYPAAMNLETMEEVTEFIMNDVASFGSSFEVDAGTAGRITFRKEGMYRPEVEYKWS